MTTNNFKKRIRFKLDTGAVLTVCGQGVVRGEINPTDKSLFGPGHTKLHCLGAINAELAVDDKAIVKEDIYIVENQGTPLLSRQACEHLRLVSVNSSLCEVGAVQVDEKLFLGLGKLQREYSITVKPAAKPFTLFVPRPIAFPLRKLADDALDKMVNDGVITSVIDEPTEWVAPMVVVPKDKGKQVRICTDFAELNKFVVREVHPMATVQSSLAMLGRAKIFSKIDANSGF